MCIRDRVKAFVMLKPGLTPCDEYRDILMAYCLSLIHI